MKIVCIADTHTLERKMSELPEGDILIHAGDIENSGRNIQDIIHYSNWLSEHSHKYKKIIQIAGNHDGSLQNYKEQSLEHLLKIENLIYLENSAYEFEGIKFYGTPITPTFFDWYFMCDEDRISNYWDNIPSDTDILITHGPPHGILDLSSYGKRHAGSPSLLKRVQEIKPKLHIFGHIHEGYGTATIDETQYINATICDERYRPRNAPVVVEI